MKKKISDILPNVNEHVVMKDFTTWKVGGVADFFVDVRTIEELIRAVRVAVTNKIPYFILGNGSHILFSDYGFPGVVIKNSTDTISIMTEKSQIICDSGVLLGRVILESISNDLSGLEFLFGIPGSIGGSVYGNAGAWNQAIGDFVKNVTVLAIDEKDGIPKISQHDGKWMDFGYRQSKLKNTKSKYKPVVLSVRFQLARNQRDEIMRRLNEYKQKKDAIQPVGASAGCIFKNPIPNELKNITGQGTKGMPDLPRERRAGYLLDQSGVKKIKVGSAQVSDKHANFIINTGDAKSADIRTLIEEMREAVRQKYKVTLDEEIEYIGQW